MIDLKDLHTIKKYLVREELELQELRKDVEEIEKLLEKSLQQGHHRHLLNYFQTQARRKDKVIQRIQKRLDQTINHCGTVGLSNGHVIPTPHAQKVVTLALRITVCQQNILRLLSAGGDIDSEVRKEKPNWGRVRKLIHEALGSTDSPGVQSIIILISNLERVIQERIYYSGYLIPRRYEELIVDSQKIPDNEIFTFIFGKNGKDLHSFKLNKADTSYPKLVKRFKKDTRKFEKYLQREIDYAKLPIWVGSRKPTKKHKKSIQMYFYLAPLYLQCKVSRSTFEWKEAVDEFRIHFDEEGRYQDIRDSVKMTQTRRQKRFRSLTGSVMHDFFSKTDVYGHWVQMSKIICESLKLVIEDCQELWGQNIEDWQIRS